jgi:endonuclease/exonuclease/phosphatase family metal-dependent hydrolase
MRKTHLAIIAFGILFLFFIQMAGTLVQSIYILDLMHTSLDAKALGVLFFFAPVLLLPFRRKFPSLLVWILFGLLFLARSLTPYPDTLGRMLASGFGTAAALLLFPLMTTAHSKGEARTQTGLWISAGLALGVGLSVLLRTLNFSIDYSLTPAGAWVGWGLGLAFGVLLSQLDWDREASPRTHSRGLTRAVVGIFLVLTLVYFAFSAPAVIARWTEGNYAMVVGLVSLLALGWAWLAITRPHLFERLSPPVVAAWNLAFTLCLLGTILAHRVAFPQTPSSPAVIVGSPTWLAQIPLVLMLLLFPVLFVDMGLFVRRIRLLNPAPRDLVPGMLLGALALVLLVFINIFTNVWGYIAPVSTPFRNMFWLPYLLLAASIGLLAWSRSKPEAEPAQGRPESHREWAAVLLVVFLGSGFGILRTGRVQPAEANKTSLRFMTYNIQAANDNTGEPSYERQLALIREVSPDVLSLQETDTARISLNNNDYALYYASMLGYYSYFGPTSVTGTFGTTILSKYPLLNTRTTFTYSDQDEIGTAEAEIEVGGHTISIYDVHPDGSDTAKLIFARTLLERSQGKLYVVALGDYNLRDYEEAYQLIASFYTNAWVGVYPSKISPDGTDMSGRNRIDHIFVSPSLGVRDPVYVLPPVSATDHPVHWAEIFWDK